ncbi:ABC-2 type transport system permease protein [Clostridium algifaecis]|uniref:ABC-2 type transport system permease protein n=1 Tax=Clostridium algifaecis TaxID=1472040 RepID=A0ABS4KRZ7_9CLOT|nr:ABC transporter permease [Clostridium algifaecis]MBP2032807.1 ABC-2 type transport system permease protein [Clostridium algifaecis]
MNILKANIINEIQKLFLKKKIIVFLVITAVICSLSTFFVSSIQAKLVFVALSSLSFPLITLSIFTNIFLPLFIFMAVSELFSGEVSDKSLKLVLIRPITRLKIFISKNVAVAIYIIINLLVVLIVSMVSIMFLHKGSMIQSISQIVFAYFIDIIPAVVLALFAAFITQFFKSSSGALITCILSFIGIKILSIFIKGLNNIIFTSYLNWYSIWLTGSYSFLRNINTLFMVLSYGVIFFTIGYYIFYKKEV